MFTVLCVSWPAYVICVDSVFNASVLIEFSLLKDIDDAPMRLKKIHRNCQKLLHAHLFQINLYININIYL